MRDKIGILMSGLAPTDDEYERLLEIPHTIDEGNTQSTNLRHTGTHKQMTLATEIRTMAKSSDIRAIQEGEELGFTRAGSIAIESRNATETGNNAVAMDEYRDDSDN